MAEISESDTTVKLVGMTPKLTLVAFVRFVPSISTTVPALPAWGSVFTKGFRPKRIGQFGSQRFARSISTKSRLPLTRVV